jgi:hypothetical protein
MKGVFQLKKYAQNWGIFLMGLNYFYICNPLEYSSVLLLE